MEKYKNNLKRVLLISFSGVFLLFSAFFFANTSSIKTNATTTSSEQLPFVKFGQLIKIDTSIVSPVVAQDNSIWYASTPDLNKEIITSLQIKVANSGAVTFYNQTESEFDGLIQLPDKVVTYYNSSGKPIKTESTGAGDQLQLSGEVNKNTSVLMLSVKNITTNTDTTYNYIYESSSNSFVPDDSSSQSSSSSSSVASSSSTSKTSFSSASVSSKQSNTQTASSKTNNSSSFSDIVYINSESKTKKAYKTEAEAVKAGNGRVIAVSKSVAKKKGYSVDSKTPAKTRQKSASKGKNVQSSGKTSGSESSATDTPTNSNQRKTTSKKADKKTKNTDRVLVACLSLALVGTLAVFASKTWKKWKSIFM